MARLRTTPRRLNGAEGKIVAYHSFLQLKTSEAKLLDYSFRSVHCCGQDRRLRFEQEVFTFLMEVLDQELEWDVEHMGRRSLLNASMLCLDHPRIPQININFLRVLPSRSTILPIHRPACRSLFLAKIDNRDFGYRAEIV